MSTIDLTLPEPMKAYVEKQVAQNGFKNAADFIISLVETHQHRQLRAEVESLLLERIDGPFEEWTDQDVEDIRREGTALINQRNGQ